MQRQRRMVVLGLAGVLAAGCVQAQRGPSPGGGMPPPGEMGPQHGAAPGQWWQNPGVVKLLALTEEQRSAIDGVLQQNRQRLFDLSMAVQREDFAMGGLMDAEQPDEAKILAQVDRLAAARAELEKANARMLLAMRRVLTVEQWRKLQTFQREHAPQRWGL